MNIQQTKMHPSIRRGQEKISQLQSKLDDQLTGLEDKLYTDEVESEFEEYEIRSFVDSQNVSTYQGNLSDWKTAGKIFAGVAGGAVLGYQGGAVGGVANGALAVAGMGFATSMDSEGPNIGEILTGGVVATALVAVPGMMGGIPGAIGGAIAGGLAASFANEALS